MSEVDVAIVGGGAAGIGAARRLAGHGRRVLIVEALDRLGGRAHTVRIRDMPLDLGCGWLHSAERNPLASLAAAQGEVVDRSDAAWRDQLDNIRFPAAAQREAGAAYQDFLETLDRDPPASDHAADAIPAGSPWRGYIDALSSVINGVETDRLSARDFLTYENASSEANWRLPQGYGAFLTGLAKRIDHRLGTRVTAVREGDGVLVETDRGAIRAEAAIVTVSTAVLASGAIAFDATADAQLHAAAQLPLGLADKLFLALGEPDAVPPESHLLGRFDSAATGSYYLRPFGRPVVECFVGGAHARALEAADGFAFAIDELRELLGSDFAKALTPLVATRWGKEPTILGSYSHALPGQADARAVLARPVSPRLAFAGEACSPHDFSTAHGAWASGIAAADHVAQNLPA